MTANPRPRSDTGALHAFGEELKQMAERLSDALSITRVELCYHPPIEADDIPRAIIDVWIDGDEDKAWNVRNRLNEEARKLEEKSGLPRRSAGIILHWLT